MSDVFSVKAAQQRVVKNADQVEIKAILAGIAVPDVGITDENLAGELGDLDTVGISMETWHEQDVQIEDEVGAARDELLRRQDIMGDAYPFDLIGGALKYRASASRFYEYCLSIATTSQSIQANPYTELPRSFERVVGVVLRNHLGPKWESLHTGWPRDVGEPTRLDELIQQISRSSSDEREWCWNPTQGYPESYSTGGDAGVDFVIWRRSPDRRIGQMYVLGQCACGNDWDTKFDDLKFNRLSPWMRPFVYVPATRCFSTPFILSDGNFQVAHERAGWVLDRMRLTMMVHELAGVHEIDALTEKFTEVFSIALTA